MYHRNTGGQALLRSRGVLQGRAGGSPTTDATEAGSGVWGA